MTATLTRTGVWSGELRYGDAEQTAVAAAELEQLGYGALWIPDVGGDLFGALTNLLAATEHVTVATGILNLWMHDAEETALRFDELTARHGNRLLLGIGVSHAQLIDRVKAEGAYRRPLQQVRDYLDALDASDRPVPPADRVIAALGPKMLELAGERTAGTHLYLVTPEHTTSAREALGPDAIVAVEQGVVLESDPDAARALARRHIAGYLQLPNYTNNWKRIGFTEADLEHGGSDRLVDALYVWGDEAAIARRVQDHRDAGASHVCVQVVPADAGLPLSEWRVLAPALN